MKQKQVKKRSQGIRSPEVVWALNLLWIGLGNYYGSGFASPLWVLVGGALYALTSLRLLGSHVVDPWLVGYAVLSLIGHVNVRRHNEKVVAEQMRTRRRTAAGGASWPRADGEQSGAPADASAQPPAGTGYTQPPTP